MPGTSNGASANGNGRPALLRSDLMRLATAGSVDDGKSTLIGRLLHDAKAILADQLDDLHGRDGMLYALSPYVELIDGEESFSASVRYRTVGDMSCTGAVASTATALHDVVAEIAATEITERGETRADDRVSEAAMEDRKVAGYF